MPPNKETKAGKAKGKAAAKTEAKTKKAVAKASKGKHFGWICNAFSHTLSGLLHSVTLTVWLCHMWSTHTIHTLFSHLQWCLTETVFDFGLATVKSLTLFSQFRGYWLLKSQFDAVSRLSHNFSHFNSLIWCV